MVEDKTKAWDTYWLQSEFCQFMIFVRVGINANAMQFITSIAESNEDLGVNHFV